MLGFLPFFILLVELQSVSSTLFCMNCTQKYNLSSSDGINTTTCTFNSKSSSSCKALLTIYYEQAEATVQFDEDPHNFDTLLKGKNVIKHAMEINFHDNAVHRSIQISCFNNNSCSDDIKKIYSKSKQLNYTLLQNDLKAQLYNASFPRPNLTCLNNYEQEIPCPNGYCELKSDGKVGFNYKCVEIADANNEKLLIEQYVLGDVDAESSFTYICSTPMCNDKKNAEKVHSLLKDKWLLTPTGVGPDPSSTAATLLSKTSTMIQCILMMTIIIYLKYN